MECISAPYAMKKLNLKTATDVYSYIDWLKTECQNRGTPHLYEQLDNALHAGSSGLEILGAIREVLINHRQIFERLTDKSISGDISTILTFIDRSFGR